LGKQGTSFRDKLWLKKSRGRGIGVFLRTLPRAMKAEEMLEDRQILDAMQNPIVIDD